MSTPSCPRQVKQAGLLERRHGWYAAKISLNLGLLAAGLVAFVLLGDSWWQLLAAAYLAVVATQLTFVGHDAGHRQIFRSRRANDLAGLLHGNLLVGISFGWWVDKHNAHHTNPNHEDLDPDIGIAVLAFTAAQARGKRGLARVIARSQACLFFPLLLLEAAHLHVASVKAIVRGSRPGQRWSRRCCSWCTSPSTSPPCSWSSPPVQALAFIAGPPGPVRAVPGLLVRAQPQGHADPHPRRPAGLPPPPGADLPQRARQPAGRLPPRRPQLPDRAPPVPEHAPTQPAPGPAPGPRRSATSTASPTPKPAWSAPTPRPCATSTPSAHRCAQHAAAAD